MELEILYQEPSFVAVDKPAGMLVHPGREPEPSEQIAMKVLRDQLGRRVSTVHRLDRPTSGVLLFALFTEAEVNLRGQFAHQTVEKTYTAVVVGETPECWTSTEPLRKLEQEPYRDAATVFVRDRVVELEAGVFSILTVTPKSGRYHQIRKHLSGEGYPIVGDFLYGEAEEMERLGEAIGQPRLMLHARALEFEHPLDGSEMRVTASLPKRFQPFLET